MSSNSADKTSERGGFIYMCGRWDSKGRKPHTIKEICLFVYGMFYCIVIFFDFFLSFKVGSLASTTNIKKFPKKGILSYVRTVGLEPTYLAILVPKTSVSTNFTTSANGLPKIL